MVTETEEYKKRAATNLLNRSEEMRGQELSVEMKIVAMEEGSSCQHHRVLIGPPRCVGPVKV